MIKFAVKVGLASAAVYYVKEQGVWKRSSESVKTYEKLKETVDPYLQNVKSKIPIEFPELPETEKMSSLVKQSWNQGVLVTFRFLSESPIIFSNWTRRGIEYTMKNEEISKFVESFNKK